MIRFPSSFNQLVVHQSPAHGHDQKLADWPDTYHLVSEAGATQNSSLTASADPRSILALNISYAPRLIFDTLHKCPKLRQIPLSVLPSLSTIWRMPGLKGFSGCLFVTNFYMWLTAHFHGLGRAWSSLRSKEVPTHTSEACTEGTSRCTSVGQVSCDCGRRLDYCWKWCYHWYVSFDRPTFTLWFLCIRVPHRDIWKREGSCSPRGSL